VIDMYSREYIVVDDSRMETMNDPIILYLITPLLDDSAIEKLSISTSWPIIVPFFSDGHFWRLRVNHLSARSCKLDRMPIGDMSIKGCNSEQHA